MSNTEKPCCKMPVPPSEHHAHEQSHAHAGKGLFKDTLFIACLCIVVAAGILHFLVPSAPHWIHNFTQTCLEILSTMWWGVALGIIIVGLMSKMPREYFAALMGSGNNFSGLLRAVFAGLFLDLCCHGILLVAAKLYERGISIAQVMTFMVASPWNSISLTLVLISLIGLPWTLLYILGSTVIALITGVIFQHLEKRNLIPTNPHHYKAESAQTYNLLLETKNQIHRIRFTQRGAAEILKSGWDDGKMIIKWLLFGTILAASLRTFIPHEVLGTWFGATITGLLLTVLVATIIEICSEGSAPVAGELFTTAGAPGNGFAFLMAGVATDYTEILAVREFTKSWKIALFLPLVTVPQVLFLGWLMNQAVP